MCRFYLSMLPEALICSMLEPEAFGRYYSTGSLKKAREQAMFFEVDPTFRSEHFRIQQAIERCVPHEDGTPKASIYVSVYRVLEHIPLTALGKLYLVTQDGRSLALDPPRTLPEESGALHLYQEIAPVHPLVASSLGPREFYDLIVKNPVSLVSLPAVCFVELRLDALASDPLQGPVGDLPYSNIAHLRQCLSELQDKFVHTKMVNRIQPARFPYRTVKNGVFVGNDKELMYYPMPPAEVLKSQHYAWWRSANVSGWGAPPAT